MLPGRWQILSIIACLVLALSTSFFAGASQAEAQAKGLNFSHSLHLKQPEVGCRVCHVSVAESLLSSDNNLPREDACLICHERKQGETCLPCHANPEHASPLKPRNWVFRFNHKIHVQLKDLMLGFADQESAGEPGQDSEERAIRDQSTVVCLACHRGMTSAQAGGSENYPTMKRCLECHEVQGDAMNHCATCHLPEADLFPSDHQSNTFFDDHSSESASHDSEACRMCHTPGFNPCTQCH